VLRPVQRFLADASISRGFCGMFHPPWGYLRRIHLQFQSGLAACVAGPVLFGAE
jgi:hypothetical protein